VSVAVVIALAVIVVLGLALRWTWVRVGYMAVAVLAEQLHMGTEISVIGVVAMLVVLTLTVYWVLTVIESRWARRAARPGSRSHS
jgi:hypothetical protein